MKETIVRTNDGLVHYTERDQGRAVFVDWDGLTLCQKLYKLEDTPPITGTGKSLAITLAEVMPKDTPVNCWLCLMEEYHNG